MSFSENLQYLRKREQLTQEQLAERLEVSRQAVSKWESEQSYPEMEKLLQICAIFRCDLNMLVQGDITVSEKKDMAGYDRHMNRFSIIIATAVSMIIAAVAMMAVAGELLKGIVHENILAIGMFVIIAISVSMLIVTGIDHEYFKKRYDVIPNFYPENLHHDFNRKFAVAVAAGVCLIFFGLCLNMGLEHFQNPLIEEVGGGIFLLCVALAVWIFIYFGLQEEKYDIEKYNKQIIESKEERPRGSKLVGKVSGVIMLLATALFIYLGLAHDMFRTAWVVYPVAAILCAVAGVIWGDQD